MHDPDPSPLEFVAGLVAGFLALLALCWLPVII